MFPEFPVLRIDRDSTRRKGSMESFISEINTGEPAILVGTQLLAKGHHFPNVTLVAMLDIDSGFYSADFRATERLGPNYPAGGWTFRAADKPGYRHIQTAFATHTLMETLFRKAITNSHCCFKNEKKLTYLLLRSMPSSELRPTHQLPPDHFLNPSSQRYR